MGCVWYVACAARCQTLAAVSHCACVWVRKFGEGVFLLSLRMNEKKKTEGKYICVSHFQCLGEKIAQNSCSYFLSDSFVQSSQCHSIPPALCTSFRRKRTRVSLSGEKDKAVAVLDPPNSSSLLILSLFRHKTGQKRIFCV